MTLENPELRSQETKAAGLVKGETACNRSACQAPLNRYDGLGWWNTETQAYYCPSCAKRINVSSLLSLGVKICITESEKWLLDTAEIYADAVSQVNKLPK
jgi:hypothetical protein